MNSDDVCEYCNEPLMREKIVISDDFVIEKPYTNSCVCEEGIAKFESDMKEREMKEQEEKEEQERKLLWERTQRLNKYSGMGERLLQSTFDTFEPHADYATKMLKGAKSYTEIFEQNLPRRGMPLPIRNGIMFIGNMGTGKTHISAAIANNLISRGIKVICMSERGLLGKIRQSYSERNVSEKEILDTYLKVPLLVIDDLGKEKATDWTLSTLYAIVDGRYEAVMPIVITTNYDPESLISRLTPAGSDTTTAECILDRLKQMCHTSVNDGESWRSK